MPHQRRKPTPLAADPQRQATGLFKGVNYQVWLTVLAWIELKEDDEELLKIEGAEDFDVLSTTEGLSVQVKALESPITLRSECVVNAIRNYWQSKHSNKTKTLRFRFATTAKPVVEKGHHFGKNIAGLNFWNLCGAKVDAQAVERIRSYLQGDPSTSKRLAAAFPSGIPPLNEFLASATPNQLHQELIAPLVWDFREDRVEGARESVRIRLHVYGERKGLSIQDCDNALSSLFEYVAHKAFQQKRILSREEFRLVFDKATRESVPKAELALYRRHFLQVVEAPATPAGMAFGDEGILSKEPDLPAPCCPRESLAASLKHILERTKFLALYGSTGTGKSTLAKLLTSRIGGQCLWISCAGASRQSFEYYLRETARVISGTVKPACVVFDSFDFSGNEALAMLRSLAGGALLTVRATVMVIVTTQRPFPQMFRREVPFGDEAFATVPPFDESEVEELCERAGCQNVERRRLWSKLISLQTQGHPQLAHARVSVAARAGWLPANPADLLVTPEDVKEVRTLSRQLLSALDEGHRELLYRLSVASRSFRRDHAIAIGEVSPAINHAGDKFDNLVGPWIESSGNNYYHLSPLLTGSGEAVWSADRLRQIRSAYGRAVMRCGNATLLEAGEALFQAVVVSDDQLAGPILARLMVAPRKRLPMVASRLDWLLLFSVDKHVFPQNRFVNLFFRQVQFRFAVASEHRLAPNLAEMLYAECQQPIQAKADDLLRAGAATDILISVKAPVSAATLIRCWLDADRLVNTSPQLREFERQFEGKRLKRFGFGADGYSEMLFGFILARRGCPGFLNEFIKAVDSLGNTDQTKIFTMLRRHKSNLQGWLDDVWMTELKKPIQSWNEAIDTLNTARAAGIRWKVPELIIASARGIAVVQDEYLNNATKALETLQEAADQAGEDGLMLRYQRGTIFSRQNDYERAYAAWASTLDKWLVEDPTATLQALFAHSGAGTALGKLSRWSESARTFQHGHELARKNGLKMEAIAFGADASYAFWRAGQREEAIALFALCLGEIEDLSKGQQEPVGFHTLWKLVEQVIMWCAHDAGAPRDIPIAMPRPGVCSEPREQTQHELLQKHPRGPLLFVWFLLAEAELYGATGKLAYLKMIQRQDVHQFPGIASLISYLKLRRAFKDQEFEKLVNLVEEAGQTTAKAKANAWSFLKPIENPVAATDCTQEITTWAADVFASALIILAAKQRNLFDVIDLWRQAIPTVKSKFDYEALLSEAVRLLNNDPVTAYQVYSSRSGHRFQRILSALRMGTDPNSKLAACFVGLMTLVTDEPLASGQFGVGMHLGALIQRVWEERVRFPAEFNSPRISIPAIQSACIMPYCGLKLAAHVLLAARGAVNVSVNESSASRLRLLSGS